MTLAGYDAWVTREPPCMEDPSPLRCVCGRFLKAEPDGVREYVTLRRCSGEPSVLEDTHDDAVLAIIGEEHRGEKVRRAWPPACGGRTAEREQSSDACEIRPEDAEGYRHEPHFFTEPWEHYQAAVRVCAGCGATNEDPT